MEAVSPFLVATLLVYAAGAPARADETAAAKAAAAMRRCERDDPTADKVARLAELDRGIVMAHAAIAADPRSARAHFSLFCNLARQLEIAGVSWRSLQRLTRVKETLDIAMTLDPRDPDILVSKGEMLRQLPPLLGGDRVEAERLLRQALTYNPNHVVGRLYLAQLLVDAGARDAAAEVARAVEIAERGGSTSERATARSLLAQLDD